MHGKPSSLHRVTRFVLDTDAGDIPAATLERAALQLLDTLGICAAATPMDAGRKGRDIASMLYAASTAATSAQMLFDGRHVSLAGALYAAANQTDNLDGHDGYNPTKGHIGVVAAPALAVLAQAQPQLRGADALASLVIGYEIAGRAGIALHASVSDYHTSGAWNTLGVVAMAARLRGHSDAQLRHGFGIAEYHGPRSQMMREIEHPSMLHDGASWGGLAGMSAAIAAEHGFTGAPALTIEAPAACTHWQDLGSLWQTDLQYIKPYPVCRWAHAAIDAARELCEQHNLTANEITAIRIGSFANAVALFPDMPATTSQAQYSLGFAVATIIAYRRIGLEHISGDGLQDAQVAALIEKTSTFTRPQHESRFPAARWADVEFDLTDSRTLASGDVHARGGPERPFDETQIISKYDEFATPALGPARSERLRDAVLSLPRPGASFSSVSECLYEPLTE